MPIFFSPSSKVWPWLSSFTHVALNSSLHVFKLLLPEAPGRLWREAASFSLKKKKKTRYIFLQFGSLLRVKGGTVSNRSYPTRHKPGLSKLTETWSPFTISFISYGGCDRKDSKTALHRILATWQSQMKLTTLQWAEL